MICRSKPKVTLDNLGFYLTTTIDDYNLSYVTLGKYLKLPAAIIGRAYKGDRGLSPNTMSKFQRIVEIDERLADELNGKNKRRSDNKEMWDVMLAAERAGDIKLAKQICAEHFGGSWSKSKQQKRDINKQHRINGARVKLWRELNNYNRQDLAKDLNMTDYYLRLIESGQREMEADELVSLAKITNKPQSYFINKY